MYSRPAVSRIESTVLVRLSRIEPWIRIEYESIFLI